VVGDGQCVAFVREATGAPHTSRWFAGQSVRGADLPTGTLIATFGTNGRYENDTKGRSHAALYLAQSAVGLRVLDQWIGQPVHERLIRFRAGAGAKANDGDQYAVVEIAEGAA